MQQLWQSTVGALPASGALDLAREADLSFEFVSQLCTLEAIPPAALAPLIADASQQRPSHALTAESLRHLFDITLRVNSDLGRIVEAPANMLPDAAQFEVAAGGKPLVGFDYVFDVLVNTLDDAVAEAAAGQLVQVYVQPYSAFGRSYPSWKTCAPSRHPAPPRTHSRGRHACLVYQETERLPGAHAGSSRTS